MKKIIVIVSLLMVFVLMISFSGEVVHVHYCFSTKTYSMDIHPSYENNLSHQLCNCNSAEEVGYNNTDDESCCTNSSVEKEGDSCCINIQAGSKSDKQYNFQVFKPQFKALSFTIFNFSEPLLFDFCKANALDFNKTQDHSPPEIITSQILLI